MRIQPHQANEIELRRWTGLQRSWTSQFGDTDKTFSQVVK